MSEERTPDPATDDYWTTSEVAAYCHLRVGTISAYRNRGQMPAPDRQIGRTWVWRPAKIVAWRSSLR